MIRYQFFPRSVGINERVQKIIDCFFTVNDEICSPEHTLASNEVLSILRLKLVEVSMKVEQGKTRGLKIPVPVLFGLNNKIDKHFDADALSSDGTIGLEVEAGRAVDNY